MSIVSDGDCDCVVVVVASKERRMDCWWPWPFESSCMLGDARNEPLPLSLSSDGTGESLGGSEAGWYDCC